MRSIIVAFYLLLYAIVSLPLFLIFYIIGKFSPSKKAYLSQKFVNNFGFRPILFLSGVRLTVKGREIRRHCMSLTIVDFMTFWQVIRQHHIQLLLYRRKRLGKCLWYHAG